MSKYEKRTPNQLGPLLFPFSLPFSHAQCSQLVLESSAWFSFRVCMVQLPFLHAKLCSPIKFHFPFIAHKKKVTLWRAYMHKCASLWKNHSYIFDQSNCVIKPKFQFPRSLTLLAFSFKESVQHILITQTQQALLFNDNFKQIWMIETAQHWDVKLFKLSALR